LQVSDGVPAAWGSVRKLKRAGKGWFVASRNVTDFNALGMAVFNPLSFKAV